MLKEKELDLIRNCCLRVNNTEKLMYWIIYSLSIKPSEEPNLRAYIIKNFSKEFNSATWIKLAVDQMKLIDSSKTSSILVASILVACLNGEMYGMKTSVARNRVFEFIYFKLCVYVPKMKDLIESRLHESVLSEIKRYNLEIKLSR